MANSKVTNRIRRLRFDNDEMTQEELANKVDCTHRTIIAPEKGGYVSSLELDFIIAGAFGGRISKWSEETVK